uniref:SUEL-type lectin domain-containing protein n=3 Tax=Parascaris univalens TaxID=6257 RepID=A0A915CCU5_PARUN
MCCAPQCFIGAFHSASLFVAITFLFITAEALHTDIVNEMWRDVEMRHTLMMESLKNNLVQACDGEKITLHCPRNTHILIENTFYGRLVPSTELCPSTAPNTFTLEDTSCDIAEAHAKVLEQCRNKRKCKIVVKPSFFDRDPCPNTSKYLQISYKCKPISFDDQNFCEGSNMQLSCKQNKRLAIYSAQYGRTVNGQAMHCTPNTPVAKDCVMDVLGRLLHECHAQTECSLAVNDHFFGNPCPYGVHKYLSLIFMCVNDEIFSEAAVKGNLETMKEISKGLGPIVPQRALIEEVRDQRPPAKDEPPEGKHKVLYTSKTNNDAAYVPGPAAPSVKVSTDEPIGVRPSKDGEFKEGTANALGIVHDILLLVDYIQRNKEKAALYTALGAATGIILLLSACITMQCLSKRRQKVEQRLQVAKSTEFSSLIDSNQTSPMFVDTDSRTCFDMGDLTHNGQSFMRFSQLTPPRVPPNIYYS